MDDGHCRVIGKTMPVIDGVLVVPAWIGPAKHFVPSKGRAYTFGLFAVSSETLAFLSSDLTLTWPKDEVNITWPRLQGGAGCWLEWPDGKYAICFGKPFPNAPSPDADLLGGAAEALDTVSDLPIGLDDLLTGTEILGNLLGLAASIRDIKTGRGTAQDVKAALLPV